MKRPRRSRHVVFFSFGAAILATSSLLSLSSLVIVNESFLSLQEYMALAPPTSTRQHHSQCAILFFGLPRSYETIVLPSIVKHVLKPNMHCDVYAHAIMRAEEEKGRSGKGGEIDANALNLLKKEVYELHNASLLSPSPHVAVATESEDDFWRLRNASIQLYRTAKDVNGTLLYFPWKMHFSQVMVDNIIRQWHSIESVWNLMEQHAKQLGVMYNRVGMFRSDVFFATPIDISEKNDNSSMNNLSHGEAIYPGFGLFPVNDRMLYGSYIAIKTWASQRFQLLEQHAHELPGKALHPETFLDKVVFPTLRDRHGTNVTANPDICLFRVRADESIWINDCLQGRRKFKQVVASYNPTWIAQQQKLVERMIGRTCRQSNFNDFTLQLECAVEKNNSTIATTGRIR